MAWCTDSPKFFWRVRTLKVVLGNQKLQNPWLSFWLHFYSFRLLRSSAAHKILNRNFCSCNEQPFFSGSFWVFMNIKVGWLVLPVLRIFGCETIIYAFSMQIECIFYRSFLKIMNRWQFVIQCSSPIVDRRKYRRCQKFRYFFPHLVSHFLTFLFFLNV